MGGISGNRMNIFFLPASRKKLPLFKHIAQLGSHFAQMVVHVAHFPVQARKRGVLGWVGGAFCVCTYPRKGRVIAE